MTQKLIVNCTTGERSVVEMEAEKVAEEKRAADRESGNAKLKELGLTDDEIAALTT